MTMTRRHLYPLLKSKTIQELEGLATILRDQYGGRVRVMWLQEFGFELPPESDDVG